SGGNDCLNTVVPYTNDLYYDFRPTIHIPPEEVLPINDAFGFRPSMEPIKRLWDERKVAVINGIGYPHPDRAHFRAMDIWHTAEPEKIGKRAGWAVPYANWIRKATTCSQASTLVEGYRGHSAAGVCRWPQWETSRPMVSSLTSRM